MRRAICEELNVNETLRRRLEMAAGGDTFNAFIQATMSGHGRDLRMMGSTANGKSAAIMVDVQIGEPVADGEFTDGCLDQVAQNHTGLTRRVTVAPAEWFSHTGNAAYAQNGVTFEELVAFVGEPLQVTLGDGIARVKHTFAFLTRPRLNMPMWAIMRMRR